MSIFRDLEYDHHLNKIRECITQIKSKHKKTDEDIKTIKELEENIEKIENNIRLIRKLEKEKNEIINGVPINDDYYQIDYFTLKVIKMKKNGYINASRLYKDNNKRFDNWLRLISSKQLINILSKEKNIPEEEILIKVMNGPNQCRGTYIHPSLMYSAVTNISIDYYFMINDVIFKAIPLEPNYSKLTKTIKLLSFLDIKNEKDNKKHEKEKYKRIKNDKEKYISKGYTLDDIIKLVNPFLIISDLSASLKDIRKILRTHINKNCGIYMFFNNETKEYYIGMSKNIISRASSYLTKDYTVKPPKYRNYIKDAMIKYTKSVFSLLILELIDDYDMVSKREMYYINLFWPAYNIDLYELI
jgi:KilA-N domain/GIY-YIG catalytic domain